MVTLERTSSAQRLVSDIDQLINEMLDVRRRVAALFENQKQTKTLQSVRENDWFGMWAEREDMNGLSSCEWLTQQRSQQWRG